MNKITAIGAVMDINQSKKLPSLILYLCFIFCFLSIINSYVIQYLPKPQAFFVWLPLAVNHFTPPYAVFVLFRMCNLQPLKPVWLFLEVTAKHTEDATCAVATCGLQQRSFILAKNVKCG